MKAATALTLGRVSNLPTVWSNLLAGTLLSGGDAAAAGLLTLGVAASLLYLAGMFLNDAFDAKWDREHRPERPIPAGEAAVREVFLWGLVMVCAALALLASRGAATFSWGLALTAAILIYDWRHKTLGVAPWLMGLCRMLVYLLAAGAFLPAPGLILAGTALLAYVAAITYAARTEHLGRIVRGWPLLLLFAPAVLALIQPDAPAATILFALALVGWIVLQMSYRFAKKPRAGQAIAGLVAGISLVDAVFIAAIGMPIMALWAVAAWGCTLALQRRWSGT